MRGDVNDEEHAAVRDEAEARADRAEINAACERVFRNNGTSQMIIFSLLNDIIF
jgi:hypothetical protein